jgi:CheY-like chemotaxis protein
MDLTYKILWFEDTESVIENLQPLIEDYLEDLGFKLCVLVEKGNSADFDEILGSENWDLILMDFMLKEGSPNGNELITRIRNNQLYTEIIFYSEKEGPFIQALKEIVLEGVYYAINREALPAKIQSIIDLTLKKQLGVENLRGLIVAETIDLVNQMDEIILDHFQINENHALFFRERVLEEEFFNDAQKYKLIQRILDGNIKNLNELIAKKVDSSKIPSYQDILDKITPVKQFFNKFDEDVISYRNNMAHAKCSLEKNNVLICRVKSKIKPEVFDDIKCKEIRKKFIEHSNNLKQMQMILSEIPV